MGGPRLLPRSVVVFPHERTLTDKLQELALLSPQDLKDLEPLLDYALDRAKHRPRSRRMDDCC